MLWEIALHMRENNDYSEKREREEVNEEKNKLWLVKSFLDFRIINLGIKLAPIIFNSINYLYSSLTHYVASLCTDL